MHAGVSDPLRLDLPEQFDTERLTLRPPHPGDGAAMNGAICESLDALKPWMPWAQHAPTVEESETLCRRKYADWVTRSDLMLTLWRRSDGVFVGGSGLHRIDWEVPCVEIGYWCRSTLTGNGYITEAVRGITRFAFEHLRAQRIEIRIDAHNAASIAVAERAGYALEARLKRQARAVNGDLRDTLIYVLFPPEC